MSEMRDYRKFKMNQDKTLKERKREIQKSAKNGRLSAHEVYSIESRVNKTYFQD